MSGFYHRAGGHRAGQAVTIRTIILAAFVPLITLLAVVNGVLYFYQSRAELQDGLDQRALAAAVSGAEFLAEMPDPQQMLDDEFRLRNLRAALENVQDLEAYFWVTADGRVVPLIPPARPVAVQWERPTSAKALPMMRDPRGWHFVAAVAPAGAQGFVAVRLDAEPMLARLEQIKRWIYGAVGLAMALGLIAGSYLARRIGRELGIARANLSALDRGEAVGGTDGLRLTEAADLAEALRLIAVNRQSEQRRLAQDGTVADDEAALRMLRAEAFPDQQRAGAGWQAAMRVTEAAPLGCFYALGNGGVVIGECAAEAGLDRFAAACAARDFIEREEAALGLEAAAEMAAALFGAARMQIARFDAAGDMLALTDADAQKIVSRFRAVDADMPPADWVKGAAILCAAEGVFAAIRRVEIAQRL